MKKRVTIIFLTLLFTILAFGKVDLYAEITDEGTQLEETTLSEPASGTEETKEEPEEAPQEKIEEVEETEEEKETEKEEEPVDQEESKEEEITKDEKAEEKTEEKPEGEIDTEEKVEGDEKTETEGEEKAEDSEEAKDPEKAEEKTEGEIEELEIGTIIDPENLQSPDSDTNYDKEFTVSNFAELKDAIINAEVGEKTKIIITASFDITETLTIEAGKDITLTSLDEKSMDEPWEKIEQPKDYAEEGEKKQREIIEKAKKRGDDAIEAAEADVYRTPKKIAYPSDSLAKEANFIYTYDFDKKSIVLSRTNGLGIMFEILGKLKLGDKRNSINFEGTKDVIRRPYSNENEMTGDDHPFFNVKSGGELELNNGIIANSVINNNSSGSNAPIVLEAGSAFVMNGGRITSNSAPVDANSAGAVYVNPGAEFIMKNGMIDHNEGSAGAIFLGKISGASEEISDNSKSDARVKIEGGYIVSNRTVSEKIFSNNKNYPKSGGEPLAGGIVVFPGATLNIKDGIVANNLSFSGNQLGSAGGILISDLYFDDANNNPYEEWAKTKKIEYSKHLLKKKAEANFKGGLLYKNSSLWTGGGIFIDSEKVNLERLMILNNNAFRFGGGVYYSFPPRVNNLEKMLITDNNASIKYMNKRQELILKQEDGYYGGPAAGAGLWNCPTGYIHIGDGHSLYIYNNKAEGKGDDISFAKRAFRFFLNGDETLKTQNYDEYIKKYDIAGNFYSHISPVTEKGNFIKFFNDDRKNGIIPDRMSYTRDYVYLRAIYSDELIKEAWSNSGVFILDNTASYGAGIGSNANLRTNNDKGDVNFKFKKHWDESISEDEYKDKAIHLDIYIVPEYVYDVYGYEGKPYKIDENYVKSQYAFCNNIYKYGEVVLNSKNNWETNFAIYRDKIYSDLPVDNGLPFTPQELAAKGLKYMVIERESGYATTIEEKYKEEKNGRIEISRELSVDYDDIDKLGNPDYYLYYVDEFGHAHYLTKAEKEGEGIKGIFSHPMLNQDISGIKFYGKDRNYVEETERYTKKIKEKEEEGDIEYADYYRLLRDLKGYKSGDSAYAFFLKKDKDGLKLYVPYLFIQNWDDDGYSGFEYKTLDNSKEKVVKTYEVDVTNRPYKEAKIKKTWDMLTKDGTYETYDANRSDHFSMGSRIPSQVKFYLLKNGERIILDYVRDEQGRVNPIYKTVTITKNDNWIGTVQGLDPFLLQTGAYSVEEEPIEGYKSSYKIIKGEDKDQLTKLRFRLYVPSEYRLIEGYDKGEKDYKQSVPFKDYFNEYFGDIKINLLIDGKIENTKTIKWVKNVNDLTDYGMGVIVYYSLDSDDILFGFDGEEITVYTKGRNVRVKYYNSMDNAAGLTDYNIYLEKDKYGGYTMYSPNLLKEGKFYQMLQITEKDRNSGYIYPLIKEFKAAPYEESIYTFEATNTELPPPPEEPKTYVTVSKVWEALGETQAIRVQLYVNGEATGKYLTLSEANGWTATFYDLDEYDFMGNRYTYTVREVGDENGLYKIGDREFEVSYAGNMDRGFTITNKEIPPEEQPEEPEEPDEPEPEEPEEPDEPEDEGGGENIIPKTGVKTDAKSIYLSLILLIALAVLKKKKYSK